MSRSGEAFFSDRPIGSAELIADEVYAVNAPFWGFPNVVYFLGSGGRWALIDTGVAETPAEAIGPFLEAHGGFESLELVMGTHGHVDHIGGNSWVKAHAPQARFALGALDAGWAEDIDRHYSQLYEHGALSGWKPDAESEELIRRSCGDPVAIDHPLLGGEVLRFGAGREIEAIHLGAHSPGQMLYFDRLTETAFSGDAVQNAGIFNTEWSTRDFPMYRTVADYRRSLDVIQALHPAQLCTAHAGIYTPSELDAFIDEARGWSEGLGHNIEAAARDLGTFTLEEMVAELHLRYPEHALLLQIRVTAAEHLDDLVRAGVLTVGMTHQQKWWSVLSSAT